MKVLGICGGNGVVLYPFRRYLIGNIEPRSAFYTKNQEQWNLNFDCPMVKTIGDPDLSNLVPDIIIGAPDCGHSSVLSYSRAKKMGNAKSNESLNLYMKSIKLYKPPIFLMENLPALLNQISEDDFREFFRGYRLIFHKESVSKWGNSQVSRERLVIIGIKRQISSDLDVLFNIIYKVRQLKHTEELLRTLSYPNKELCHIREDNNTIVCMEYKGKKLNLKEVQDLWLGEYSTLKKWPVNNGRMKNLPGVYRNKADDYPLTARKQSRQFNPDGTVITPRELARIQGIPDRFHLWYSDKQHGYSINKARVTTTKCPPYEIGLWFFKQCKKLKQLNVL